MSGKLGSIYRIGFLVLLAGSCVLPGLQSPTGSVSIDFRAASRAVGVPSTVASVDIAVNADDMDEIKLSLTTPTLSASIEVPAGTGREFEAVAKDSAGRIRFKGRQSVDIVAGTTIDLSIQMSAVYALSYVANGADSGIVPAPLYKAAGEAVSVAANSGGLARAGYSFAGWNTAADGSGTDYSAGQNLVMPASDLILYANWVVPSANANLAAAGGLVVSGVVLAPAFDPTILSYTASADSSVPSVTVTAIRADPGASIQVDVNGDGYNTIASGSPTGSLLLEDLAGANTISVLVTAADAVTTKTYMVSIAKTVLVTISASANGSVNIPGSVERTPGATLPVTAIPDVGYRFKDWTGDIGALSPPNMAATSLNVPVVANTTVIANFELDIFADGDGTVGDPFQVTTLAHLIDMNSYRDKAFVLMADIDLISQPNWLPIGDATTKFTGRFDGNGHTLSNLTINVSVDENRGLFGYTDGAIISGVSLAGVNFISTYNYAGALIGRTTGATQVSDCSAQGTISAYQSAGGLIGYSDSGSSLSVTRCSASVDVVSMYSGNLGGLIGRSEGGTVTRSYATGNLVGHTGATQNYVGGLIGYNLNSIVDNSFATGTVEGDDGTGGFIGYNSGSSSVANCYSVGAVTGTANIGGLIGFDSGTTISSSYYDQATSGQSDTGKGEPLATTDMQDSGATSMYYPGWDFGTIWQIIATAYPTLR